MRENLTTNFVINITGWNSVLPCDRLIIYEWCVIMTSSFRKSTFNTASRIVVPVYALLSTAHISRQITPFRCHLSKLNVDESFRNNFSWHHIFADVENIPYLMVYVVSKIRWWLHIIDIEHHLVSYTNYTADMSTCSQHPRKHIRELTDCNDVIVSLKHGAQ